MEVNNKYQMSDYQCLLGSWTIILEKLLREKHGMEENAARELAILNRDLLLNLSDGVVTFQYEREDGTICVARGTLRRGISEAFDEWTLARAVINRAAGLGITSSTGTWTKRTSVGIMWQN